MSKSPNHYNGRNGWKPDIICCHVTEGGYPGAVSWLCNPAAQCSAHFVVGANGQKEQLVDFKDGAWCNGNTTNSSSRLYYKNALNPIVRSRATNANYYTYSIEHEGYSYKDRYGALTESQYQATLDVIKLMINDMKNAYGVIFTPDRDHLIGHYAIDPKGKPNCPSPNQGANFPFDRFIKDIKLWMGNPSPTPDPTPTNIKTNDLIRISNGATYYGGSAVPNWVLSQNWYVKENPSGDRVVIDKSENGSNSICSPISSKYLTVVKGSGGDDPSPVLKSANEIATEVIAGKWGNGEERKQKLTNAGYNYSEIQDAVNSKLGNSAPALKSVTEIAKEVINGKWGNGSTRKEKLTAAGYNYTAVQSKVNELLK